MPKLYVIPLGFQVDYVIRFLVRVNINNGDGLLVLVPRQASDSDRARSEKALKDLEGFLAKIGGVSLDVNHVDTLDPASLVLNIVEAVARHAGKYDLVVMASTGGVRVFTAALPLASLILMRILSIKLRLYAVSENSTEYIDLTPILGAFTLMELNDSDAELLRLVDRLSADNRCVKLADIASYLEKDLSTVRRQVYRLEELGLILRSGSRNQCVALSYVGRMMLGIYGLQSLLNAQ